MDQNKTNNIYSRYFVSSNLCKVYFPQRHKNSKPHILYVERSSSAETKLTKNLPARKNKKKNEKEYHQKTWMWAFLIQVWSIYQLDRLRLRLRFPPNIILVKYLFSQDKS